MTLEQILLNISNITFRNPFHESINGLRSDPAHMYNLIWYNQFIPTGLILVQLQKSLQTTSVIKVENPSSIN